MHSENIAHALFTCPLISDVWFASHLGIRFQNWPDRFSCYDVFSHLFSSFPSKSDFLSCFSSVASIAYCIWLNRNDVVFNNKKLKLSCQEILLCAQSFLLPQLPSSSPIPSSPISIPKVLKSNIFLMISDGSFDLASFSAGVGFVYGRYPYFPSFAGSNRPFAISAKEAKGIIFSQRLKCALDEGVSNIVVMSDCQVWVNKLNRCEANFAWQILKACIYSSLFVSLCMSLENLFTVLTS
ncbi:hypothetical protein FRX31_003500 [Thalictrum thalictroides]|uniref:Uncharacterized protein n=1 Tax=Thalictrum thalictroides TaxID=46969 RepID=A0A7J6XB94_THATH|nr:hypothetical protein FRX31_003500 [Thalictrum thalictroides]